MKRKLPYIALVLVVLLAVGSGVARATPGSWVDWFTLAGGGGSAGGGSVTLQSTVGQPIAGPASGGQVSLGAGYWYAQELVSLYLPVVLRP